MAGFRTTRGRAVVIVVGLATAFAISGSRPAGAGDPILNPPLPASAQPAPASAPTQVAGAVHATLIHPWPSDCTFVADGWTRLAAHWRRFGTVPLSIDTTTFCDPLTQVTYDALVANGADVLVFSDVAGGNQHLTDDEIAAVARYAQEGHNVVGTYVTLFWNGIDNRGLAPVFGIRPVAFTGALQKIDPTYAILRQSPLFRDVADPYVSSGFPFSETPASGSWTDDALRGAKIAAINADASAAVLTYRKCTYRATYITNMPEYGGSAIDLQVLYNALTRPKPKGCAGE
jgi:hypothetical protein